MIYLEEVEDDDDDDNNRNNSIIVRFIKPSFQFAFENVHGRS